MKATIDGFEYEFKEDELTVLEACRKAGVDVPTFCDLPGTTKQAACRICIVEIDGMRGLQTSCNAPLKDGMVVRTNTAKVRKSRKNTLELILANHPYDCRVCDRNGNCKLQKYSFEMGVRENPFVGEIRKSHIDSGTALIRDPERCILCGRCVRVCSEIQTVNAIQYTNRGFVTKVETAFGKGLEQSTCVSCGQCVINCPVGALCEQYDVRKVWGAMKEGKHVVVQAAPSVRVALGEEFGMPIGTLVVGKMYSAFKRLGFSAIFDTNFGADLTIMEEGSEFVKKFLAKMNGEKQNFPLLTSCCPGWVKFVEEFYPELIPNLSTAMSPEMMVGSVAKTYYAEKLGKPPEDIFVVSVMPCTAKKFEITQEDSMIEYNGKKIKPVDIVITTRELARMIKQARIDFANLPEAQAEDPLACYTGAGAIFAVTGGVMEAALRTGYYIITGEELGKVELNEVRGFEGVREATIDLKGKPLKVAVAHGLGNARKLMDKVMEQKKKAEKGEGEGMAEYDFIEVMACPGGCINGGGQPIHLEYIPDLKERRAKAIYCHDESLPMRKSHENPSVKKLYDEFYGKPYSEKAHKLLHRSYEKRDPYG